ncbi:MAG: serine/threonine protein kinase [Acidimicrobiia bacterium]|nr:serine/threonine protein kinase [Acidimicrobiia bacterium]
MTNTAPADQADTSDDRDRLLGGRYRLERLVATGHMAQVWEATDLSLERRVAVKVLFPRLAGDAQFVARFRREAAAAARLAHPGIVAIYDSCREEGIEAIVMEFVRGPSLRGVLDDVGTLPVATVVRVGALVCEALAASHEAGLVHRDIKPANILIEGSIDEVAARVVVADFGIAKAMGDDSALTRTGAIVGTAKYLAPEQVDGRAVDARSDVYSLGIVLYEALAGRVPFNGDNELAVAMARLQRGATPLAQACQHVPAALASVIDRTLAVDPSNRFASALDLRAALLSAQREMGVDAPERPGRLPPTQSDAPVPERVDAGVESVGEAATSSFVKSERSWLSVAAAVIAVAVAVALLGWGLGRTGPGNRIVERALSGAAGSTSASAGPSGDASTGTADSAVAPAPVKLVGASFDPLGDGNEHEESIPALFDDDPSSSWTTQRYDDPLHLLKSGVGFRVSPRAGEAKLHEFRIVTESPGWRAEIFLGGSGATSLADWGTPVTRVDARSRTEVIDLGGVSAESVLVWFTELPLDPARGGHSLRVSSVEWR